MKRLLFLLIIFLSFCMNAEVIDIYKSVNCADPSDPTTITESVTFACTITDINNLSELRITRRTNFGDVLVVNNGVYNPDEWYARYDTLEHIPGTQNVRFADTFIYPFGTYDRHATYVFELNYNTAYIIEVNFSKDPDVVTDINEITYINRNNDKVYDVYGQEVFNLQPNTVYIKNGKKFIVR